MLYQQCPYLSGHDVNFFSLRACCRVRGSFSKISPREPTTPSSAMTVDRAEASENRNTLELQKDLREALKINLRPINLDQPSLTRSIMKT